MQNHVDDPRFTYVLLEPGSNIVISNDRCITCNKEVLLWCEESIRDVWAYDIFWVDFKEPKLLRYSLKFLFKDPRDAVLFKLTWG